MAWTTDQRASGRCVMRLQPREVHLNHNGTVNAPVLHGLAEFAGAGRRRRRRGRPVDGGASVTIEDLSPRTATIAGLTMAIGHTAEDCPRT